MKFTRNLLFALFASLMLLSSFEASAQRFAYVNTDYILSKMSDYDDAQKEIDRLTAEWRKEVDTRKAEVEKMYKDFQNEQFLLTDDQKNIKIQAIEKKEMELKQYQQDKFGYQGELFKKRQELVKPIQDRIYDAIEKLARERGYDFVFDKANSTTMLYANTKNDKSDEILKNMGISVE